jgi:membrane-bound serine protease (ClpP class)
VYQTNWWLVGVIILVLVAVIAFVLSRIISTYQRQAATGKEDLIGKEALVKEALSPEGTVLFQGELWNALSESGNIEVGEEVLISRIDGLKLIVTKK